MSFGDVLSIFFIAIGLAADCFAVAICSNLNARLRTAQIVRAACAFGLFQSFMCYVGWIAGTVVLDIISNYDHWVAFGLLAVIGGRMIWGSLRAEEESRHNVAHWWQLLVLSIATSIDSLAVGLSFGVLQIDIGTAAGIIGVTTFLISVLGFYLGRRLGGLIGRRAETIGGAVLIIIGLRILVTHVF